MRALFMHTASCINLYCLNEALLCKTLGVLAACKLSSLVQHGVVRTLDYITSRV